MSEELLKQTNDIDYGSIYKTKLPVKMIKNSGRPFDDAAASLPVMAVKKILMSRR